MAVVKPFICIRPAKENAAKVAALPYDVYNRKEACAAVAGNPISFLNIDRAETQFSDDVDTYADCVYEKARELLDTQIAEGVYVTDAGDHYYLYELTMDGRSQTGIVACSSIDDYVNGVVKKHENTREDKEIDRIRHVDTVNAQTGPIFLAYRQNETLKAIVAEEKAKPALYDFVSDDGIRHRVWKINDPAQTEAIEAAFAAIPATYIADGHHSKGEVNRQIAADNKLLKEIKARITRLYRWSKAETEKPQTQQSSLTALWEAQQQLNAPRTRTGKIRALQESAALFSFLQANGIQSMQQLHEKIADMNSRYYDLRGKIVKAERRITTLTERGEMWEQYNQYKSIHKQLAKVKPEKREQFEQRHSRELILYDAAARYLKELKDSDEAITPKAWQLEINQLAAGKQTDTLAMKAMREDLKAVERLRKTAEQLSRQERDKSHDREPER